MTNLCDECGKEIGKDSGPPDGWQLEDGRTVCHQCCVRDTSRTIEDITSCLVEFDGEK